MVEMESKGISADSHGTSPTQSAAVDFKAANFGQYALTPLWVGLDCDDNLAFTEHDALTAAYNLAQKILGDLHLPAIGTFKEFVDNNPGKTFRNIMAGIFEERGYTPEPGLLDSFVVAEKDNIIAEFLKNGVRPTPGTLEVLHYLSEERIAHPVVSSSHPDRVEATLQASGLLKYFDVDRDPIFSAQAASFKGKAKPAPDVYLQAHGYYPDLPVMLVQEDSRTGAAAGVAAGAVVIGNVGAQVGPEAQTVRAKALLDTGVSLVLNHNASMIGLVEHLKHFDRLYTRDNVEQFLAEGGWIKEFAAKEAQSGRSIWLSKALS